MKCSKAEWSPTTPSSRNIPQPAIASPRTSYHLISHINPSHPKAMRRTNPLLIQQRIHPLQDPAPTEHGLEALHPLLIRHEQKTMQTKDW